MARKLRSLTWTGDPSLDHLHNTQQVTYIIVVAEETLMMEYKPKRVLSPCFTTDDSLMVRLVTTFQILGLALMHFFLSVDELLQPLQKPTMEGKCLWFMITELMFWFHSAYCVPTQISCW